MHKYLEHTMLTVKMSHIGKVFIQLGKI